ncbi:hypothetical protein GN958_ATG13110, partial [Phytophthora infestans]
DPTQTVLQCPKATTDKARELVKESRKKGVAAVSGHIPLEFTVNADGSTLPCGINGAVKGHITLDTGTEYSIVAESLGHNLRDLAAEAEGFGGAIVPITQKIKLDIGAETLVGKLIVASVVCWISPEELPAGKKDFLQSRPLMRKLGYDPVGILSKVREQHSVLDMESVGPEGKGGLRQVMAVAMNLGTPVPTPEEAGFLPDEAYAGFPEGIGNEILTRIERKSGARYF